MARQVLSLALVALCAFALLGAVSADPDPLDDFASPTLQAADFVQRNVTGGGIIAPAGSIHPTTVAKFLGSATLGLSQTIFNLNAGSVLTPHWHARATEMAFVTKGTVKMAFVSDKFVKFENIVNAGDISVLPRGLLHFQECISKEPCEIVSTLDAQDPGADFLSKTLAALPQSILETTFQSKRVKFVEKPIIAPIEPSVAPAPPCPPPPPHH